MNPILRIKHPSEYPSERRYVFDVVFDEFLGITFETVEEASLDAVHIETTARSSDRSITVAEGLFATQSEAWLQEASLPRTPLDSWTAPHDSYWAGLKPGLPIIYKSHKPGSLPVGDATKLTIPFDLFGGIFFLLTRYEEMVVDMRDEHRRFPATASLAGRGGFLTRPIVDEYVELLWQSIKICWPGVQRRQREYRLLPTHDVDWPFVAYGRPAWKVAKSSVGDLIHNRGADLAFRRLRSSFMSDARFDPANTFDFIMSQSERHNLESEFFFVTGQSSPLDGAYDLDHPSIKQIISNINSRGHRLGLHGSYDSYRHLPRLRSEFARLITATRALGVEQDAWGGRQHYLRWENPTTWRNLDAVGLDYDSTLGFADRVGFRTGTCHEYPVFDLKRSTRLKLREKPLIAMDQTLLHPAYMGVGHEDATRWIGRLAEACRLYGGTFVLLWHNSSLTQAVDKRLYSTLLDVAAGS